MSSQHQTCAQCCVCRAKGPAEVGRAGPKISLDAHIMFAAAPTSPTPATTLRLRSPYTAATPLDPCMPSRCGWKSIMSMLVWIILGLIAGFIASKIVNRTGEGVVIDILLGIVGAVVGGWLFHALGMRGVNGLNLYSIVVAVSGAAVVLFVYHALFRGSRLGRA